MVGSQLFVAFQMISTINFIMSTFIHQDEFMASSCSLCSNSSSALLAATTPGWAIGKTREERCRKMENVNELPYQTSRGSLTNRTMLQIAYPSGWRTFHKALHWSKFLKCLSNLVITNAVTIFHHVFAFLNKWWPAKTIWRQTSGQNHRDIPL